ncbi:MAG: hypothetical protein EOP65_14230 [Sphingomonas sp.]|nr:MAG: hypothetical protein EOP65_14230 [Sphingomonas sp.]
MILRQAMMLSLAAVTPAVAQDVPSAGVTAIAEVTSDEVRRGLSWSGGRAAVAGALRGSLGAVDASVRAVTLRDSPRHAGAEAVVDLTAGTGWDLGAIRLDASAIAHLFAGARERMDYVELGATAGYGYGPVYATLGVAVAPSQAAIGGSNVHLRADANAGIPGTPFTLLAGLGHSSGGVTDPLRAQRLRPDGSYLDWRLGVEHRRDRLTFGIDYLGSDVAPAGATGRFADAAHAGDRLVGRAQLSF